MGFLPQRHRLVIATEGASCLQRILPPPPWERLKTVAELLQPGCTMPGPLSRAYLPYRGAADNQAPSVPCNPLCFSGLELLLSGSISPRSEVSHAPLYSKNAPRSAFSLVQSFVCFLQNTSALIASLGTSLPCVRL